MAIALDCPCGASLRLPSVLAGHVGRCPACGLPLRAPDEVRAPAPGPANPPASTPAPVAPAPVATPAPTPTPAAAARPLAPAPVRSPAAPLPRIVRVECMCRRLVVAPGAQVAAGTARCPTCDRTLEVGRIQP